MHLVKKQAAQLFDLTREVQHLKPSSLIFAHASHPGEYLITCKAEVNRIGNESAVDINTEPSTVAEDQRPGPSRERW